jgi:TRAP-type C4-dicarboxylate transport system substrate-binding protein
MTVMIGIFSFGAAQEGLAKPIELRAVGFLPENHALAYMTIEWVKRINKELSDEVNLILSGPEAIPADQQADAVKDGVVDISFNVTARFSSLFPEGRAFFVSKYSPNEERERGFYDFMDQRFKRINMKYVGRWLWSPFYLWIAKPVTHIEELKGMKLRSGGTHFHSFMLKMGIVPVTIQVPDVYTGLERGTVDGFGWPLLGPREMGWTDSCKYIIDHPFHDQCNAVIIMNRDVWNKLPKRVQDKMIAITSQVEQEMVAHFKESYSKEWEELDKMGVKRIVFPQDEAKRYINIIHEDDWEILTKRVPDLVPELKRVTGF